MRFFDDKRRQKRKRTKGLYKEIVHAPAAEKMLQHSACRQPCAEGSAPLLLVRCFQLRMRDAAIQIQRNNIGRYFTAVQRHAHTVAAKRRNHAAAVAQQ